MTYGSWQFKTEAKYLNAVKKTPKPEITHSWKFSAAFHVQHTGGV